MYNTEQTAESYRSARVLSPSLSRKLFSLGPFWLEGELSPSAYLYSCKTREISPFRVPLCLNISEEEKEARLYKFGRGFSEAEFEAIKKGYPLIEEDLEGILANFQTSGLPGLSLSYLYQVFGHHNSAISPEEYQNTLERFGIGKGQASFLQARIAHLISFPILSFDIPGVLLFFVNFEAAIQYSGKDPKCAGNFLSWNTIDTKIIPTIPGHKRYSHSVEKYLGYAGIKSTERARYQAISKEKLIRAMMAKKVVPKLYNPSSSGGAFSDAEYQEFILGTDEPEEIKDYSKTNNHGGATRKKFTEFDDWLVYSGNWKYAPIGGVHLADETLVQAMKLGPPEIPLAVYATYFPSTWARSGAVLSARRGIGKPVKSTVDKTKHMQYGTRVFCGEVNLEVAEYGGKSTQEPPWLAQPIDPAETKPTFTTARSLITPWKTSPTTRPIKGRTMKKSWGVDGVQRSIPNWQATEAAWIKEIDDGTKCPNPMSTEGIAWLKKNGQFEPIIKELCKTAGVNLPACAAKWIKDNPSKQPRKNQSGPSTAHNQAGGRPSQAGSGQGQNANTSAATTKIPGKSPQTAASMKALVPPPKTSAKDSGGIATAIKRAHGAKIISGSSVAEEDDSEDDTPLAKRAKGSLPGAPSLSLGFLNEAHINLESSEESADETVDSLPSAAHEPQQGLGDEDVDEKDGSVSEVDIDALHFDLDQLRGKLERKDAKLKACRATIQELSLSIVDTAQSQHEIITAAQKAYQSSLKPLLQACKSGAAQEVCERGVEVVTQLNKFIVANSGGQSRHLKAGVDGVWRIVNGSLKQPELDTLSERFRAPKLSGRWDSFTLDHPFPPSHSETPAATQSCAASTEPIRNASKPSENQDQVKTSGAQPAWVALTTELKRVLDLQGFEPMSRVELINVKARIDLKLKSQILDAPEGNPLWISTTKDAYLRWNQNSARAELTAAGFWANQTRVLEPDVYNLVSRLDRKSLIRHSNRRLWRVVREMDGRRRTLRLAYFPAAQYREIYHIIEGEVDLYWNDKSEVSVEEIRMSPYLAWNCPDPEKTSRLSIQDFWAQDFEFAEEALEGLHDALLLAHAHFDTPKPAAFERFVKCMDDMLAARNLKLNRVWRYELWRSMNEVLEENPSATEITSHSVIEWNLDPDLDMNNLTKVYDTKSFWAQDHSCIIKPRTLQQAYASLEALRGKKDRPRKPDADGYLDPTQK
ncbi:hypothetical protein EJ08DRAFT_679158 [Tothia fuscella]|uniref:Uncharacterized protein n=1 Tax=Tothia fuscella TaxID=1048955 RepID=A0A9P4NS11_9PEZI|nr:hypothetical protein EJ08DRAFT_679158 [Tothia fuscella]